MTDAPDFSPAEPDEPRDVRVARALGWVGFYEGDSFACPPGRERYQLEQIPNFSRDPAFILRMIEANRLVPDYPPEGAYRACAHTVKAQDASKWSPRGDGANLADAVLSWILAAHDAGVKIRTEVEHGR